jgi:hypothetical protein
MSKRGKRRILAVRVEYEPNRLSRECLQKTYQLFSPTAAIRLSMTQNSDELESDQEVESDAIKPSRKVR